MPGHLKGFNLLEVFKFLAPSTALRMTSNAKHANVSCRATPIHPKSFSLLTFNLSVFRFDNAVCSQPKRCHYRGTSLDEMLPALSKPRSLTSAFSFHLSVFTFQLSVYLCTAPRRFSKFSIRRAMVLSITLSLSVWLSSWRTKLTA